MFNCDHKSENIVWGQYSYIKDRLRFRGDIADNLWIIGLDSYNMALLETSGRHADYSNQNIIS